MNVQGTMNDGTETGTLEADIHVDNATGAEPKVTVKGRFASFPLAMAGVLAKRWQPGLALGGSLHGFGYCVGSFIKNGKPSIDLSGELVGNQVQVSAPFLAETLDLERVEPPRADCKSRTRSSSWNEPRSNATWAKQP